MSIDLKPKWFDHLFKAGVAFGIFLSAGPAIAATSSYSAENELRLPERLKFNRTRQVFSGKLKLTGNQFLSEKRTTDQSESYGYLSLSTKTEGKKGNFDWAFDGLVEGSSEIQEEFYVGVPELFARLTDDDSQVKVTIGRQKRKWSRLDSDLNLGLWQPQLRWDYLNPIQQGLTGAFFDLNIEALTVTLFASPVFLPDQGPQFDVKDGRFVSANRWFWQPQSQLRFADTPSNLYYDLIKPSEEQVVMNSSLGGMISFDPSGPLYSQFAYAYKPMNQFFIGFECTSCIDAPTLDARARIHPKVINHHVMTWETGWMTDDDHAYFSLSSDRPKRPEIPEDWGGTSLSSLLILGGSYTRKAQVVGRPIEVGAAYMRAVEVEKNEIVSDLGGQVESSNDRFLFEDLLSVMGSVKLYSSLKSSFNLSTKYSYSFLEKGAWLSAKVSYQRGKMETHLGLDILGSQTEPLSSNAGLFSRYRSNDRVFGGVGFVF